MIKPDIQEKFDNFMQSGRIALFCAPCGFGKTTVVRELLKTKKTYEISADALDVTALSGKDWNVLIVDNLQFLPQRENSEGFVRILSSNKPRKKVCVSVARIAARLAHTSGVFGAYADV